MIKYIKYRYISLVVLLMLFCTYPYVFHLIFSLPDDRYMGIMFFIILSIFLAFQQHKKNKLPSMITSVMFIQSIIWLIYSLFYSDTTYLSRIFFILLTYLSLQLLIKTNSLVNFVKLYNLTIFIQGVLGVIAFILVFIGILKPIFEYYYSDYRYLFCYGITCSNAVLGKIIRVGGFFDEPGAFAFWGVYALLLNKFTIDDKKIEITIISTLLFTFSAAYFVILPIYLASFYYHKIKSLFLILLIIVPICYITMSNLSGDSDFAHITTERFSNGEIRSTRYDQTDYTKIIFLQSPFWGIGAKNMEQFTEATDNPYEILAKDGIIGFIITYLPLLIIMIRYKSDKRILFGSLILFLNYMQRPFHINEMHHLILYLYCLIIIKIKKSYENSSIINVS